MEPTHPYSAHDYGAPVASFAGQPVPRLQRVLGFHLYLYEHDDLLPHTAAHSPNNDDFPTGRSAFWYTAVVAPTTERLTVGLMLGSDVSRAAWPQLFADRAAIEAEMGFELEWNSPANQKIWTVKISHGGLVVDPLLKFAF